MIQKLLFTLACLLLCITFSPTIRACPQVPSEKQLSSQMQNAKPVENGSTHSAYNPLAVSQEKIETLKLTIKDSNRNREIPLLVYLPKQSETAEVILFSHGLGGSRETSKFLGKHWAGRGYVAVFMQHPGSDESIWKDLPLLQRPRAFKKAITKENSKLRVGDVPVVIDQLEKLNLQADHPLQGRMNTKKIGMSGHSFGAITTQYVGGQTINGKALHADDRITACMMMSPSPPSRVRQKRRSVKSNYRGSA